MYVNGIGFRGIERVKDVHHPTVITWVKQIGAWLPDAAAPEVPPEVGALAEREPFVGSQKTKFGCGQPLTTSEKGFEGGLWETIVLKDFDRYGRSLRLGSAISMARMVGVLIQV